MAALVVQMLRQLISSQTLERCPEPEPVMVGEERCHTYASGASAENLLGVFDCVIDILAGRALATPKVLDLACGSGELLALIADRCPGARLVGVDASPDMLHICRDMASQRQDGQRFRFEEGDITHLSGIEPESFDVVTWTMAAHHMPGLKEVQQVLKTMQRVARPEGVLLVLDLGRLKSKALNEWYIHWAGRHYDAWLLEEFGVSMRAAYTARELRESAEQARIEGLTHFSTFGLPVLQVLLRAGALRPHSEETGWQRLPPPRTGQIREDYQQLKRLFALSGLKT